MRTGLRQRNGTSDTGNEGRAELQGAEVRAIHHHREAAMQPGQPAAGGEAEAGQKCKWIGGAWSCFRDRTKRTLKTILMNGHTIQEAAHFNKTSALNTY